MAKWALLILLAGLQCGCTAAPKDQPKRQPFVEAVSEDSVRRLMPWLRTGTTTRDDMRNRFGEPARSLERGSIWCYRLSLAQGKAGDLHEPGLTVAPAQSLGSRSEFSDWRGVDYSLVLLIDRADRIVEFNLIPTRTGIPVSNQ